MKTPWFKSLLLGFAFTAIVGCSSDDSSDPGPVSGEKDRFVLMTSIERFGAGYFTALDGMPSGTIQATNARSLQVKEAFGFRAFGKWFFNRSNAAGDLGLQKYSLNADGSLKDEGFIAGASQYLVVDETTGYYLDETRSLLKLQKFNPTTMLRTGEIDLSVVQKEGVEYQVVGKHTIAAKEGKLFVGITYSTKALAGYGGDVFNAIEFAVVDIATGKYEKTIRYDGMKGIGWGSSGNKMWSVGDDGALYLYSTGLNVGLANTAIIRIKKGETDFDRSWIFSTRNLQSANSIVTALVKGGKLYFESPSEPLKTDFSNLQNAPIFDYYAYDMATGQVAKIEGMPQHEYAYANEQAITEIDGKIYLWVKNSVDKLESYYVVDGNKATQVFKVALDGAIQGFVKLSN
ncbi:hypothetical protein [Dyadobacter sp. 676]|uniref:DUF4374 domain-containing protein n=1 Tax=Dyadobacter sp. 676 TaxID=3088362 RepID=A0AAU8FMU5_9BACT